MTPDIHRHVRKVLLKESYGTADEQKDALVEKILGAFQNPEVWPMTNAERIVLLRELYRMAEMIRRTETA